MVVKTKKEALVDIDVKISTETINMCILGTSPLICNRMSQKVMYELLMPKGRKTQAEKAGSLKHDPLQEFRDSPYTDDSPKAETLILGLATWFKSALRTAALDIPGATKSQIGRLTYVNGHYISIYGVPKIFCSITRAADIKRTPDVRTRAIIPEWACKLSVTFTTPILKGQPVLNLMAAAGVTMGVGDWRPEKGSGNFGQFRLCNEDDPEFKRVLKMGRASQVKAMKDPEKFDVETADLLDWFNVESKRRGFKVVA